MPSKLKPPTRSSEDYSSTAVGAIFVTKPVSLSLPQPIGVLRFNPPIDAAGRSIPVPIYKALLPVCPEEYIPEVSRAYLEHELVRMFWSDMIIPKLGLSRNRQADILQKSLLKIRRENKHRDVLLPDGLVCEIKFESLLTTSDLASEIHKDEAYVQGLYSSYTPTPIQRLPVPVLSRNPEEYSTSIVGLIVAKHSGCINLPPFGKVDWDLEGPSNRHNERYIFIDVIPLLPEEHCGGMAIIQRERALFIDRFWDMRLSKMLGPRKHARQIITSLKQRIRPLTNHEMLPHGLVARMGFGNLRPIHEQFPDIIPDMLAVRKVLSINWPRLP